MSDRYYITTPIYYPNGEPHLGHVYTTLCADVLARYHRLKGERVRFLTGTDEHGVKMVKTAAEQGIEPQALADRNVAIFESLWKELHVTHDDFIRTTSHRHKSGVAQIVERMLSTGDIYLGAYEGWYDEGQEEFVTETAAKEQEFKSAISGRPLVRYKEPTYFFRLTKYVPRVLQAIESDEIRIRPEPRKNEVVSKLKQGVEDLSISRSSLKWGILMPGDPKHVIYVWIDALSNYITSLGYGTEDDSLFHAFWPADVHLIGKEIMWFHTVYWPAMLMSLGVAAPRKIYAHGWWTSDGKKMSKSMGNFIGLEKLRSMINLHSLDALRYYLLRAAPFGNDLDWTDADFLKSFNELANVLGNCLNRTIKMIGKYCGGVLPEALPVEEIDRQLIARIESTTRETDAAYDRLDLQQAAMLPVDLARAANVYIDSTEPFKLAKDPAKIARLHTVLNLSAQAIHRALLLLLPILPEKSAVGLRQLNVVTDGQTLTQLLSGGLVAGHRLGEGQPLFPKAL